LNIHQNITKEGAAYFFFNSNPALSLSSFLIGLFSERFFLKKIIKLNKSLKKKKATDNYLSMTFNLNYFLAVREGFEPSRSS